MDRNIKKLLILLAVSILLILIGNRLVQPAEIERAEFSGIVFKTRYQIVKINTPILVEMEKDTRLLAISLKNPETTKFKFLLKITPRDFERWQESIRSEAKNIFLLNNQRAYFVSGKKIIKIGEITINIDSKSFEWIEKNKNKIEQVFKSCKMALSPSGYPDMVCSPLLVEAKITRIERSNFNNQETILILSEKKEQLKTGSPTLPEEYKFPHLDYIDIYIEILSIGK